MGIKGLFPIIKPIFVQKHISDFSNQRVAIDAHGWLHRATYTCATELCRGIPTSAHIDYVIYRVKLLLTHDIKPILVFDGGSLPQKAQTHHERRTKREEAKAKADELYNQGQKTRANEFYQKACPITHEMVYQLVHTMKKTFKQANIHYIVAPYEADAQLTWMILNNHCDLIITEDSDLLVYGATKILYKLSKTGHGDFCNRMDLGKLTGVNLLNFTNDMFMYMCVCSGCDFFQGVHGLGIKKSYPIVKKHKTIDRIFLDIQLNKKIPNLYNVKKIKQEFTRACLVFKHQTIYDLNSKEMKPLNPLFDLDIRNLPKGVIEKLPATEGSEPIDENNTGDDAGDNIIWDLSFLGTILSPEITSKLVKAKINPRTLQPYDESLLSSISSRPSVPFGNRNRHNISRRVSLPVPAPSTPIPSKTAAPKIVPGFSVQPAGRSQLIVPINHSNPPARTDTNIINTNSGPSNSLMPRALSFSNEPTTSNSNLFDPRSQAKLFNQNPYQPRVRQAMATSTVWSKFQSSSKPPQSPKKHESRKQPSSGRKDAEDYSNEEAKQMKMKVDIEHNIPDVPDDLDDDDDDKRENDLDNSNSDDASTSSAKALYNEHEGETNADRGQEQEPPVSLDDLPREDDENPYIDDSNTVKQDNPFCSQKTDGLSRIMRRFAAKPIEKRLKFVDTKPKQRNEERNDSCNVDIDAPPSPDHNSFRLFDEIDEKSREAQPTEKIPSRGSKARRSSIHDSNKVEKSASSSASSLWKKARNTQSSQLPSPSPKAKSDSKGKIQIRVSRFFSGTPSSQQEKQQNGMTSSPSIPSTRSTPSLGLSSSTDKIKGSPAARVSAALKLPKSDLKRSSGSKRKFDESSHEVKGKKIRVGVGS